MEPECTVEGKWGCDGRATWVGGRGTGDKGSTSFPCVPLTWMSPSGDFSGHLPWLLAPFQMGDHVWLADRRPCLWGGSGMALCAAVLRNQPALRDVCYPQGHRSRYQNPN